MRAHLGLTACLWLVAGTAHADEAAVARRDYQIDSVDPDIRISIREVTASGASAFGEGRVVIFVHGHGLPARPAFDIPDRDASWAEWMARRGYAVYLFDFRNCGWSTRERAMAEPTRHPAGFRRSGRHRCGLSQTARLRPADHPLHPQGARSGIGRRRPAPDRVVVTISNRRNHGDSSQEDTFASRGQKLIYHGPLKPLEKVLLQSLLVPWAYFASNFYHNVYWYPFVGRKRVKEALQTRWGQLFKNYGDGRVTMPGMEPKTVLQTAAGWAR